MATTFILVNNDTYTLTLDPPGTLNNRPYKRKFFKVKN